MQRSKILKDRDQINGKETISNERSKETQPELKREREGCWKVHHIPAKSGGKDSHLHAAWQYFLKLFMTKISNTHKSIFGFQSSCLVCLKWNEHEGAIFADNGSKDNIFPRRYNEMRQEMKCYKLIFDSEKGQKKGKKNAGIRKQSNLKQEPCVWILGTQRVICASLCPLNA